MKEILEFARKEWFSKASAESFNAKMKTFRNLHG